MRHQVFIDSLLAQYLPGPRSSRQCSTLNTAIRYNSQRWSRRRLPLQGDDQLGSSHECNRGSRRGKDAGQCKTARPCSC